MVTRMVDDTATGCAGALARLARSLARGFGENLRGSFPRVLSEHAFPSLFSWADCRPGPTLLTRVRSPGPGRDALHEAHGNHAASLSSLVARLLRQSAQLVELACPTSYQKLS